MSTIQEKATTHDSKHGVGYYKKLAQKELLNGLDVPVFEIVKDFKMVKNAVCIRTKLGENVYRYIVKHYDTIILQWTQDPHDKVIEVLEYNCSPTSNRQIDGIMCKVFPNIPRSDYTKLDVCSDRQNEFKGSIAWKEWN